MIKKYKVNGKIISHIRRDAEMFSAAVIKLMNLDDKIKSQGESDYLLRYKRRLECVIKKREDTYLPKCVKERLG